MKRPRALPFLLAPILGVAVGAAASEAQSAGPPVRTDRTAYAATLSDSGAATVPAMYGFTLVATLHNRTADTLYLHRCEPDSPTPVYDIVVDGHPDEGAAWTPTWMCAAFRWHEPLAPGEARTDTFRIDGPTGWDGRTGQPEGVLEGRFRLEYDLGTCWRPGEGRPCRAPDSLGISNAFEVRLPPDTAGLRKAIERSARSRAGPDSVLASLYRRLVQADLDRGDLQAADRDSREAVRAVGWPDARLWALRARALHREGRPAEALAAVDSAIAADASYREGYLRRGLLQIEVGQGDRALAGLRAAVDAGRLESEEVARALSHTIYVHAYARGRFEEAARLYTGALPFAATPELRRELRSGISSSYLSLGRSIVQSRGDHPKCATARRALAAFENALRYGARAPADSSSREPAYVHRQRSIVREACGGS